MGLTELECLKNMLSFQTRNDREFQILEIGNVADSFMYQPTPGPHEGVNYHIQLQNLKKNEWKKRKYIFNEIIAHIKYSLNEIINFVFTIVSPLLICPVRTAPAAALDVAIRSTHISVFTLSLVSL